MTLLFHAEGIPLPKIDLQSAHEARDNVRHDRHKSAAAAVTAVRKYGVYARSVHDTVQQGEIPMLFITREQRDEWMADGAVRSINRGRDVRLNLNLPPRVQPSSSMGASVAEGCANGKRYALACRDAWRPQHVVATVSQAVLA